MRQASLTSDDLYVIASTGGQPRRIAQNSWSLKGYGWSTDGKSLLALSSRESNKPQMWQFPLKGDGPYRVGELDAAGDNHLSISRRKGSLAWVQI